MSRLKRYTGLDQWNVFARQAIRRSLAEPIVPPPTRIPAGSNVEMSSRVFGGRHDEVCLAVLRERCRRDGLGLDDAVLATQFRWHLCMRIAYLAADRRPPTADRRVREAEPSLLVSLVLADQRAESPRGGQRRRGGRLRRPVGSGTDLSRDPRSRATSVASRPTCPVIPCRCTPTRASQRHLKRDASRRRHRTPSSRMY